MREISQKALDIWNGGACNQRAVARALVDALDGATGEDPKGEKYAPARLILAQLAHLMGHYSTDGHGDYKVAGDDSTVSRCDEDMRYLESAAAS